MHETMTDFLKSLRRDNRASTAETYELGLMNFQVWLDTRPLDPLKATRDDLVAFQRYLASDYRSPQGGKLGRTTQATRLAAVKSYYLWMNLRDLILHDPAKDLVPPKSHKRAAVHADHLTQQEATALLQTQARHAANQKSGTRRWALAQRNLALLCLAIATGRRRTSLLNLRVKDLDFQHDEIRIEWEKGKPGRVLPCIPWAMQAAKEYVKTARPFLLRKRPDLGWLFVGYSIPRVTKDHLRQMLKVLQAKTVSENPDLTDLAAKHIRPHGLRVTFATMLFLNGANIRTVNELLMHVRLSTTARYTPLELDDVRRALKLAHPRA